MGKKPFMYGEITCSVTNPLTGVRCGKPSHNGKHARCEVHKEENPETVSGYGAQLDFSGKASGTANANRGRYHKK